MAGQIRDHLHWFHTARIRIILRGQVENIRYQIMQDFAKNTSVVDRELAQPVDEWKLDSLSVLFGFLLGAIVVFAGLKAAEYREIQSSNEKVVETTATVERNIDFEFYEILTREGLYPARQASGIKSQN